MHNLPKQIRDLCVGYDLEYIQKTLSQLTNEIRDKRLQHMNPCPICKCTTTYIARDEHEDTLFGICQNCHFSSPGIPRSSLPTTFTPAAWRYEAVKLWNSLQSIDFFSIMHDAFGKDYQLHLASEECFELIEATIRFGKLASRTGRDDRDVDPRELIAELADVIITGLQVLHEQGIDHNHLIDVMDEKIQRICNSESVRTAIHELSRRIITKPPINASTAEDGSLSTR